MNARNNARVWPLVKARFFWVVLFIIAFGHISSAQAALCFSDPQRAYAHLLAQEKLETQALTQMAVNINRASEAELTTLRGIGSSKAQAIILYRDMFGEFKTIDELANVKGIGAKTIDNNRARLQLQN